MPLLERYNEFQGFWLVVKKLSKVWIISFWMLRPIWTFINLPVINEIGQCQKTFQRESYDFMTHVLLIRHWIRGEARLEFSSDLTCLSSPPTVSVSSPAPLADSLSPRVSGHFESLRSAFRSKEGSSLGGVCQLPRYHSAQARQRSLQSCKPHWQQVPGQWTCCQCSSLLSGIIDTMWRGLSSLLLICLGLPRMRGILCVQGLPYQVIWTVNVNFTWLQGANSSNKLKFLFKSLVYYTGR